MRPHERAEQPPAATAQQHRDARGVFVGVFGGDPAPRVDGGVAGHVDGRVAVDVGDAVGFEHHATRPSASSSSSAAALKMAA